MARVKRPVHKVIHTKLSAYTSVPIVLVLQAI